jgi:hypothetical protein
MVHFNLRDSPVLVRGGESTGRWAGFAQTQEHLLEGISGFSFSFLLITSSLLLDFFPVS